MNQLHQDTINAIFRSPLKTNTYSVYQSLDVFFSLIKIFKNQL